MAALAPLCQSTKQLGWPSGRRAENRWSRIQSEKSSTQGTSKASIQRHVILCREAEQRASHGTHKNTEDSVTAILTDVIQHCFNKECDDMREKVVDQMGNGLAALLRVSMSVAANSSTVLGISNKAYFATIEDGDLEQVRRLLQLTSLPFHNTYEEDLGELMNLLQAGEGGPGRRFTGREVSQIRERIGSDLVECLGTLAMCFPELPLWAKHRALVLPAEVAAKVALNLLAGPKRR